MCLSGNTAVLRRRSDAPGGITVAVFDGVVAGEVAGEGEMGPATAGLIFLLGISTSGAGGDGLGRGIGVASCTCGGFAEGFARIRGSGADIFGAGAAQSHDSDDEPCV